MRVAASYETLAGRLPGAPLTRVKVAVVSVVGSMSREKVTVTLESIETPVAPTAGVRATIVGATLPVVKRQETGPASGVPSAASTVVERRATYVVSGSSCAAGVIVMRREAESYATAAATGAPSERSSVAPDVTVVASRSRVTTAEAAAPSATRVAPFTGEVEASVGAAGTPSSSTSTFTK